MEKRCKGALNGSYNRYGAAEDANDGSVASPNCLQSDCWLGGGFKMRQKACWDLSPSTGKQR